MRTARYLTLLVKSAILLSAINANAQGPFTIKGKLTGHRQTVARIDYRYFTPDGVEHYVNDSAVVKDGGFTFKGQVAYPVHAYINLDPVDGQGRDRGLRCNFYLNAGVTTIGYAEDEKTVLIAGGADQQAFDDLQKHQAPLHDSLERILAPGHQLADNMDTEGIEKLRRSAAPFFRQQELFDSIFIATHPDSEAALDLSLRKMTGHRLDTTKARIILQHFSEKVRQWPPARLLAQRLAIAQQIQPGKPAPDFTVNDLSGKPVSLSAYRGKYVLLIFTNYGQQLDADKFLFNLKNAHKRLATEDLVMLTALSDPQTDHALELIRANGLDWVHIRNNSEPGKDLARTYSQDSQGGVLIGPDGKLIRTDITFDSDISAQIMDDLPGAADRLAKAAHASGGDAPLNVFVGEDITEYPKVQWLKGGPLTHFDKDKIYIVELWATWCVPCVAAMPHLSDLQQKFRNKNVVIIAQQIWENDRSKVEEFVKNKGKDLDYWVAYSGPRGSDFDKRWCVPAQVSAIPRTFVIQDGKLVWQTYPALLNEEVLQLLVDRQFTISKAEALSSVSAVKKDTGLLPLDKAVRTGKLSNGFTYYIRHNEEPKNKVVMYLVTKAGSILETDDQQGLAHFMEHMSFNGTKHFPKGRLVDYLERSGVRFGADLNAYTSYDETVYQLPLPTDRPGVVDNGIQIMRDWAHEATLDPREIDAERGVVLEEKRMGKGAGERMREQYFPVMLNGSRYSKRLPIGIDSVLNNFRPETIRRFYHDWYRPDLQALIIVGDIDVNRMEQTVKAKFGDLKNPVNEKPRPTYTIPITGKNHFMVVTDKEATSTGMQLFWLHNAPSLHTAADYRNMLIRNLFNQMMGFRIRELSIRTGRPFLDAGVSISGFMGGLDYFSVEVGAKQGALEEGVLPVLREVERARRYGFTASELQRAEQQLLSRMESGLSEKDKTRSQSYVSEYVQYFLKGDASPGIDKEYELTRSLLKDIRPADFIALAKEYMPAANRNILITAPEKEKADLPDEARVLGWLASIQQEELQSYQDGMDGKSLFSTQPVAGRIIDEQKDTVLNTTTLTLSNGVKVVLKATDFRNNEIAFTGFSDGGTSLYSDADYQSAANSVSAMTSDGVGSLDKIQLGKYLTGKQASAFPFINERYQGFRGSAEPKDLATALQLVYAYFTQPRVNAGLFKTNLDNVRSNLANRANDPGTVFQDTMAAVLSNYNVRRMTVTPEKLDQINFDRAVAIARERFSDASGLTFVFVGNINIDSIRPLLEKYLGSLPATHKNEAAVDLNIHIPEGHIEKTIYRGVEPRASVALVFSGPYRIGLENNLNMGALKEVLQIRMNQRLRESESGVYSPGVRSSITKYPETWSLTISFECGPQNVEKLIAAAQEEIDMIKASGPSRVNIDKFKAQDKEVLKGELKSNEYWLGYLSRHLQYKDDIFQILSYDKVIEKVTAASVQAAANNYLNGKNYIRLVLMPSPPL